MIVTLQTAAGHAGDAMVAGSCHTAAAAAAWAGHMDLAESAAQNHGDCLWPAAWALA